MITHDEQKPRCVIITGGASGIGRAIASAFVERGDVVALFDVSDAALANALELRELGKGNCIAVSVDVTDADAVAAAVERVANELGTPDVLCNNAGIPAYGSVADTTIADWERCIAVNLTSVFLCSKFVLPKMLDRGRGAIVNTISDIGLVGAPARAAYCAAKGGVANLTRQMACDYASFNIRVNGVAPAAVDTPFLRSVETTDNARTETMRRLAEKIPMRRLAQAEEVAAAVTWLASDAATFVTGAILSVDGGSLAGK